MNVKLIFLFSVMMNTVIAQPVFKPERIQKSATITVKTSIDRAFPLFGPVREKEWAAGWEPQIIYSTHPEWEEHMIFTTAGKHSHEDRYVWVVSQFRPNEYFIEYTVSTAQRIWFISVRCAPDSENTKVSVTYTYTGLTEEGNQLNKSALSRMFAHDLRDWEEEINQYLASGKK
jgi:uncharacterized DUF497 family protein